MQINALKQNLNAKYGQPVWSSGNRFLWSSNAAQLPAGGGNANDLAIVLFKPGAISSAASPSGSDFKL
jgi:hypothetical protein